MHTPVVSPTPSSISSSPRNSISSDASIHVINLTSEEKNTTNYIRADDIQLDNLDEIKGVEKCKLYGIVIMLIFITICLILTACKCVNY
jgi:hypothetical protein